MTDHDPTSDLPAPPTRRRKWSDWLSIALAWAGERVRRYGALFGIAALLLGGYNVKLYNDARIADSNRSLASDIIGCNIGNGRVEGYSTGLSDGVADGVTDLVFQVVEDNNLELSLPREEVKRIVQDAIIKSLAEQDELQPRDCSEIPTLTLPVTTTTVP